MILGRLALQWSPERADSLAMARSIRKPVLCAMSMVIGVAGLCAQGGCRDRELRVSYEREPEIQMSVVRPGTGAPIVDGKRIELHYTMSLEDGTTLIDTRANNQAHRMYVGDGTVIKGFDDGIRGMQLGEIRRLVIPPELGYGRAGYADGTVPANAKLVIEVELTAVN